MTKMIMIVESIAHFPGRGTVMQGRLRSGLLQVEETVRTHSPANVIQMQVKGLERMHNREPLSSVGANKEVGGLSDLIDFKNFSIVSRVKRALHDQITYRNPYDVDFRKRIS